jgi:hypothetical protein
MLYWSDFQIAKAIHKEREQMAQQQWMLKQAFAKSREARVFSRHIEQWLHNLKRVFSQSQHEQGFDCCGA